MSIHDRLQPPASPPEPFGAEPVSLRLANGLRVLLLHLPDAQRAAAFIRVAAGSHDAPLQYPGLAHFFEHLVFLGSTGFSAQDGLLAYVRACAGEVNASTRERHTEYFFEVPASKLGDGLARLCDMLAQPLLEVAAQLREREVLQAEFVARGQDRNTLSDTAVGQALAYGHPVAGFHAGNRDSLKVEQAAFQLALEDFHQRFYQAGQMQLVLSGPQPLEQLRELAQHYGMTLRAAPHLLQSAAPALLPLRCNTLRLQVPSGLAQLSLYFALQGMPAGYPQAVDFLRTWLTHEVEDGLLDTLRSRGWCDALEVRQVYQHGDQALLALDFELGENTNGLCRASIRAALFDWLGFLAEHDDWADLRQEYAHIAALRLQRSTPLQQARHWGGQVGETQQAPSEQLWALRQLLGQLQPANLVELTSSTEPVALQRQLGFTLNLCEEPRQPAAMEYWNWHLPKGNPFLRALPFVPVPGSQPALAISRLPGPDSGDAEATEAALYLHWQFATVPAEGLFEVVQVALRAPLQLARQAGVQVRFEQQGSRWQLLLDGRPQVLPALLAELDGVLRHPPNMAWGQGIRRHRQQATRASNEPLVRQLWQHLPALFQHEHEEGYKQLPTPNALAQSWPGARLQAMAVAVPDTVFAAVQQQVAALPGRIDDAAPPLSPVPPGWHWHEFPASAASEAAVVLGYPLPPADARAEAAWRLLAQWLESPFFQRLRSELQLGYAVFCGVRQIAARPALVFAVQSPSAGVAEIVGHIEAFLLTQGERLATLDNSQLQSLRDNLHEQLLAQSRSVAGIAEQAWQALQRGLAVDWSAQLVAELEHLQPADLQHAHQQLLSAAGGCYGLGNAPRPDLRWQLLV